MTEMGVFLKAVETGSFAAAASRLGLSPQMVGKYIATSPDYLARRGMPKHPAELRDHECLDYVFPAHPVPVVWRFRSEGPLIAIKPTGRLLVNDSWALIDAALLGFGIVLLAELLLADHLASGRLIRVLEGYEGPSRPMRLVFAAHRAQAPKLRAFLDWAGDTFAPGHADRRR